MYVIFPADEVVYCSYGTRYPLRVIPRPTLDNLVAPLVKVLPAPDSTTDFPRAPDIFDYGRTPPPRPRSAPGPQESKESKLKKRFLRLKRGEDPNFGKTQRSPNLTNCELPAPLPTPAFSKKNIFDRDFDALFEVSSAPEFAEHVRVITPELLSPGRWSSAEQGIGTDLGSDEASITGGDWAGSREPSPPPTASEDARPSPRPRSRSRNPLPRSYKRSDTSEDRSSSRKGGGFFSRLLMAGGAGGAGGAVGAAPPAESVLRDLTHPAHNEHLKSHNAVSFKLVKTVSDFSSQLSQLYEHQASELQMLVATYRKRNGELRKERPSCPSSLFHTWETLLQEVEADSQAHSDVAAALSRQVARPLVERTFHRKLQARKLFAHREGCESIISKTEEKLSKCRAEYKSAQSAYSLAPSQGALGGVMDAHNGYVQQLRATNGMLEHYHRETLPLLLQELEEIYSDLCSTLSDSVLQGAEVVASRAQGQARRYEGLSGQCRALSGTADLAHLVRALPTPPPARSVCRPYAPPQGGHEGSEGDPMQNDGYPPALKDELVLERLGPLQIRSNYDALKKEALDLELQIKQLQDSLDSMVRMQQRSLESHLYNKVNEVQEDISMKKFDLRVAQIHLSAVKAQKELFAAKSDAGAPDRKLSSSSGGSMKNKWLKAFKSLKPAPSSAGGYAASGAHTSTAHAHDKKNGGKDMLRAGELETHNFLEYTYKKITPCDVCSQVLRGHTRQGLRCRLCKMNVHADCLNSAGRCQTKSRLLRRQKSTSEIEARGQDLQAEEEMDPDGWEPGQRLNRQLSFREPPDFMEEMAGTCNRPFGQPLSFVPDVEEPPPALKSKKSVRRKK